MAESFVIVETCNESERINPHQDAIAWACHYLGYSVYRWYRHQVAPRGACCAFVWGSNLAPSIQASLGCRVIHMELGWTLDRWGCLQLDERGTGGLVSWADEPLAYRPGVCLEPPRTGDLLVCLRYDGGCPLVRDQETSPWFADNVSWIHHLRMLSALPLRIRPHYASLSALSRQAYEYAAKNHIQWDRSETFVKATEGARAVAVVDSTIGVQAMELGLPVLCYGKQVCRQPAAVYCLDNSDGTAAATAELLAGRSSIDKNAVAALLARVRARQWYLVDIKTFPARLRKEFVL